MTAPMTASNHCNCVLSNSMNRKPQIAPVAIMRLCRDKRPHCQTAIAAIGGLGVTAPFIL